MVSPSQEKPAAVPAPQPDLPPNQPPPVLPNPPPEIPPVQGNPQQLAEFNQWTARWNNYQTQLSNYWKRRYRATFTSQLSKKNSKAKRQKKIPEWETADFKWDLRYQELLDFKKEHGHVQVPTAFEYQYSPPLGGWLSRQKSLEKKENLDAEKKAKLDQVGVFVEDTSNNLKFTMAWNSQFMALQEFRDINGHIEVPENYKPLPGTKMCSLDHWIIRQRHHFKRGNMPGFLRDKLSSLGVNLAGSGRPFGIVSDEAFEVMFLTLRQYFQDNGDCDVPAKYREKPQLARFVKELREHRSQGLLPENRIKALDTIGFNWYLGREEEEITDPWERKISELMAYKSKTGHCNVPQSFSLNLALGDFVFNQRLAYKEKKLSDDKIRALDKLEFSWVKAPKKGPVSHQSKWDKHFDSLVEYKEKHGHLDLGKTMEATSLTGRWVHRQRKSFEAGKLESDKVERLKSVGFTFDFPTKQLETIPWKDNYEDLKLHKEEHGDLNVPTNSVLYNWIGTQKEAFRKGKMLEERVTLLDELEFDWTSMIRTRTASLKAGAKSFLDSQEWDKMYKDLQAHKENTGKADAPQRDGPLGAWVHYNRFYRKNGKLDESRIERLDALDFVWNKQDELWDNRYKMLVDYKNTNGLLEIPSNHELYSWCLYQKRLKRKGTLPEDKVSLLSDIGFDFKITDHIKGKTQARTDTKKAELPWEQESSTINALGVVRVPQLETIDREEYLEQMWEKSLSDLQKYKEEFGDAYVPISYKVGGLGAWAFSQRIAYKKGKLSERKTQRLIDVGFQFSSSSSGQKPLAEQAVV